MATKIDYRDFRRGGFYRHPDTGSQYASVTTILDKALKKDLLEQWKMKMVYRSILKDPQMSEQEAMLSPYKVSEGARGIGTTVHSLIEAFKTSQTLIDSPDANIQGFAKAFYKWVKDYDVKVVENEKTVFSDKYMFAGTTDMICTFGDDPTLVLVDFKTGKAVYDQVFLQLSAYRQGLSEAGITIGRMYAVVLKKNDEGMSTGNYICEEGEDQLDVFLSLKHVWEWMNKDLLKTIGYTINNN